MVHSQEKSQFLTKEARRSEGLATQLAAAHQQVVELSPTARELADLRVREKYARDDAREAREKLMALIDREHTDAVEAKQLWKERDDLHRAVEGLRT